MKRIKELAQLAKSLERQTAVCKQCGVCLSACPLYPQTGLERDTARGKIALLEGVMSEVVKNAASVRERLDRCLLCGGCASVCPNGVRSLEIFFQARMLLTEYLGLSPLKRLLFRQLLARPERFDRILRLAAGMQGLFLKPTDSGQNIRHARPLVSPLLAGRHVVPLAPTPFHRQHPPGNETGRKGKNETVLFFTGCLIDRFFPTVGRAAVNALQYHGFDVVFPKDEGCCGIPALSAGDDTSFRRLLSHNLEQFKKIDFDRLVTACATCAFTIKKRWPEMIGDKDEDGPFVRELADKTMDICELLARLPINRGPSPSGSEPVPVTYHDPCHLKKSLGVFQAPRQLITANPHYNLVEMKEADTCCGMGGGFGLAYNALSEKIGRRKLDHIIDSGCRVVATACPACMIQLAGLLSKHGGKNIRVCHPVELYLSDESHPEDSAVCAGRVNSTG